MEDNKYIDSFLNICQVDKDELIVVHQNIRSMRENFESFVNEFRTFNALPHIFVFSEIWIRKDETNFYKIDGYNSYYKCNENHRAGGVIVFVNDKFRSRMIEAEANTFDVLNISLELTPKTKINLLAVYRLHTYSVTAFTNELEAFLENISDKNLVFCGDLNICVKEVTPVNYEYLTLMASFGFEQQINAPTRVTRSSSTSIDHIFYRSRDNIACSAGVIKIDITDHYLTYCLLEIKDLINDTSQNTINTDYPTYKFSYDLFYEHVSSIDWCDIYYANDVDVAYQLFLDTLKQAGVRSNVKVPLKSNYKPLKPWMTYNLYRRINKRNQLYKKTVKHPNNINLLSFYKNYKSCLAADLKSRKNSYYYSLFESKGKDTSAQWKLINDLTGCHRRKNNDIILIDENNVISSEPSIVANKFNDYFVNIVSNLRKKSTQNIILQEEYKSWFPEKNYVNSFFLTPVCMNEIVKILKGFNDCKSSGIDGISVKAIKLVSKLIAPVLAHIINLSFELGIFPHQLKRAVVVPIFKKGDVRQMSNYRPISILPIFSKLIEKLFKCRLISYYEYTSYFSPNQYGFLEGKSTEDALLAVCNALYEGTNISNNVAGLFIDICKAFDCVSHEIILSKLWLSGVRGVTHKWFCSYLSNRFQQVKIAGSTSEPLGLSCGVPQGSVLGAILFLVYVNDLCNGKFHGKLTAFADDTALTYNTQREINIGQYINEDLNKLKFWFEVNRMIISNKTKLISFNLRGEGETITNVLFKCDDCVTSPINVSCDKCMQIEQCDSIKYLGVVIDRNLTWKKHIKKIKGELVSILRKFYFLRFMCPIEVLRMLYFSLVESRLQYGLVCWGGTYITTVNPLIIAQKKLIRVIMNKGRRFPSRPLFITLKIMPMRHLYIFRVLRIFYLRSGNVIGQANIYSQSLRTTNRIGVPRPYKESFRRSFSYLAPKLFNWLPPYCKECVSLYIFQKKAKEWLQSLNTVENMLC
jgi:hypothetical protein